MKKQPQKPLVMCANTMERENLSKTGPVMLILGRVSSLKSSWIRDNMIINKQFDKQEPYSLLN